MEINEALEHLLRSTSFKDKAKVKDREGSRLRMFVSRYQRGEVSPGNAVSLLDEFGYTVDLKAPNSHTEM